MHADDRRRVGAAAEAAVCGYQLSDDRTPQLYSRETAMRPGQGRLTFLEVRVLLPRASFSARLSASRVRRFTEQLGRSRDEIFGFYTFIVPRGDAPERRLTDNLRNAYTVN